MIFSFFIYNIIMKNKNILNTILNIIISIAFVFITAGLSRLFTKTDSTWFLGLDKPSSYPPDLIFPIMWSIIYTIFAVTIFFLLKKDKFKGKILALYIINSVLNIVWCYAFFTLYQTFLGLVVILANLIIAILLNIELRKVLIKPKILTILNLIYPYWLTLATCLNLCLWILN